MEFLEGTHIKIDTPTIKKYLGRKVKYLLRRDYDHRSGGINPRVGVITELIRKQINFGNSEFDTFNSILEIVLID